MKVMLFAVLEKGQATRQLINQIIKDGYNGTLIRTKGLKHMGTADDHTAYISLSQIAENTDEANTTLFFILEEDKVKTLREDIARYTDNFKKIHGAMFELPVTKFEGSF
jgi:predicted GTPase